MSGWLGRRTGVNEALASTPEYRPKRAEFRQPAISTAKITKSRNTTAGVECPKCEERSKALRTGHDERGRVIRQRRCPNGHEFSTIEVPTAYSYYKMLEVEQPRVSPTGKRIYRPRYPTILAITIKKDRSSRPRYASVKERAIANKLKREKRAAKE